MAIELSTLGADIRTLAGVYPTVAAMLADTTTLTTGQVIYAGGFSYQAVESGEHLSRDDDQGLKVIPVSGAYPFDAWGANGDATLGTAGSGTDDYDLLVGVIEALPSGSTIWFDSQKVYRMGTTLNLKKTIKLISDHNGLAATGGGAGLQFDANLAGIIVNRFDTYGFGLDDGTYGSSGADGSVIEGLFIYGGGTAYDVTKPGVWLRARATLRRNRVSNFEGNGVQILATAVTSDESRKGNANNWVVDVIYSKDNGGHGFLFDGADVNAGYSNGIDCTGNGRSGIYDSSFLGNSHRGAHCAFNGLQGRGYNGTGTTSRVHYEGVRYAAHWEASEADLVATTPGTNSSVWLPDGENNEGSGTPTWQSSQPEGTYFHSFAYYMDSANARAEFFGCYSEGGANGTVVLGPGLVVGGLHAAGVYSGAQITASSSGTLNIGRFNASTAQYKSDGAAMTFEAPTDESGEIWRWEFIDGNWLFRHENLNARISCGLTSTTTTESQPYKWLMNGFHLRSRYIDQGAEPDAGDLENDDIILNSSPSIDGNGNILLGWMKVAGSIEPLYVSTSSI